jgi:hypothetical protein
MPPKKKNQKLNDLNDDEHAADSNPGDSTDLATLQRDLQAMIDRRLKQQTVELNDLFIKESNSTKAALVEIKESQGFLAAKFEELVSTINEVKAENSKLQKENDYLNQRVKVLEEKFATTEMDVENTRRYSRRDTLEIQGVPVVEGENTNSIVLEVARLAVPNYVFDESMLSVSHRLPSARGNTPTIIAKFVRRYIRNMIYSRRRNLSSKSSTDLGFSTSNRIYINESLTPQSRAIFGEVKKFRNQHHFKFIWTRNGKVFLKKDESQQSIASVFDSMEEFEKFRRNFLRQG